MTLEEIFHQLVPDMDPVDITFLLKQLEHSETSKSTASNLLIKLKIEFAEQLSHHKRELERAEQERRALKARSEQLEKVKLALLKKAMDTEIHNIAKRRKAQQLEKYMENHWVVDEFDVPELLKKTYRTYKDNECISKPWIGRAKVIKHLY